MGYRRTPPTAKKRTTGVAGEAGVAGQAAGAAVGAGFSFIAEVPARGKDVTVTGFGRFSGNGRRANGRRAKAGIRASANASPPAPRTACPSGQEGR